MDDMIEVKTAELVGPALDWAVATSTNCAEIAVTAERISCIYDMPDGGCWTNCYRPSTDWSQGGLLISKHLIAFVVSHEDVILAVLCDDNGMYISDFGQGETHLIAACRSIVSAKLGDSVKVPAEIVRGM